MTRAPNQILTSPTRVFEKKIDNEASSTAEDIQYIIDIVKNYIEDPFFHEPKLKFDAQNGIAAWKSLIDEIGLDVAGVFRMRQLVPFVMIPRHVSARHGAADPLSLLALLRQAQEAFIYGIPFAAIALMRAILEVLLKEHYSTGADLSELINKAKRLPESIPRLRLHELRLLANRFLHPNDGRDPNDVRFIGSNFTKERLSDPEYLETEIVRLLIDLQNLIEQAPDQSARRC